MNIKKNNKKVNSFLLSIYIYLQFIIIPMKFIIQARGIKFIELICLLLLNFFAIILNNNKINIKVFFFYIILLLILLFNFSIVTYKEYIYLEIINILLISFLPMYFFSNEVINYNQFMDYLFKFSIAFTFLFPIFYYMRTNNLINYFELGLLSHFNSIFIFYKLIKYKNKTLINWVFFLINIIFGLVLGSRMVFLATILTCFFVFIILTPHKNLKYYIKIFITFIISLILSFDLLKILEELQSILLSKGIISRNLRLFILVLQGTELENVSSGRDYIYPLVIERIKTYNGLPQGLGVTRYITDGVYYHSHNILLESLITFGIVGTIMFVLYNSYKIFLILKYRKSEVFKYEILVLFLVPFLIRSFVGTYFLTDESYWLIQAMLIFYNRRRNTNEE